MRIPRVGVITIWCDTATRSHWMGLLSIINHHPYSHTTSAIGSVRRVENVEGVMVLSATEFATDDDTAEKNMCFRRF
jgi:hypothetical protein